MSLTPNIGEVIRSQSQLIDLLLPTHVGSDVEENSKSRSLRHVPICHLNLSLKQEHWYIRVPPLYYLVLREIIGDFDKIGYRENWLEL